MVLSEKLVSYPLTSRVRNQYARCLIPFVFHQPNANWFTRWCIQRFQSLEED
ncbi:hypothetical protein BLIJ_0543 [Bifidobacterium longum subsp. infantis ATCC 15697 = JCM 1222 = DSM 20088]|nr:hypothetical protein BLIJ_0543 [Bifidobacterium longum subsp. infantis ATCC 15697 = JCM 1222 = DSM 20088]